MNIPLSRLCIGCCVAGQICAGEVVIDVSRLGIPGDRTADCAPAINQAIKSLPPEGGTILFPRGTYYIGGTGVVINRSAVVLKGAGADVCCLRRMDQPGAIVQSATTKRIQSGLVVSDLSFDGGRATPGKERTACIALYGNAISDAQIARCVFFNIPGIAILLNGTSGVSINDSTFRGTGRPVSTSITLTRSANNVSIRDNRFLYPQNGIIIDTGDVDHPRQYPAERIVVSGNFFDLGWWAIKEVATGEGASVRYTEDSLVDEKASFQRLLIGYQQNVRVLPVKQRGRARFHNTTLDDPKAAFLSHNVRSGDLVRVQSRIAIVRDVPSETSLAVEAWLSDADRQPAEAPANDSEYTAYGVLLGMVRTFTPQSIKTRRWWDFDGKSVTPSPGTRYEILSRRPNYALHAEAGVRDITVSNNVFKRGWSDQVSIWGERAIITDNTIEDGEDMGITLYGGGHRVTNNRINHQGAGGIWLHADDCVIENNQITDSQWVNDFTDSWLGDIMIDDGNRNVISQNKCERMTSMLGYNGIVIAARKFGSKGNVVRGNISRGHLKSDIRFTTKPGAKVSDTVLDNSQGKVVR